MTVPFLKTFTGRTAVLLAGIVCLLASGSALAQSTDSSADTLPPVIELEELAEGVADSSQVFTVQIAEENELRDATLYHRRQGQEPYEAAMMEPLGASGLYTVSIATDAADLRPIEYYVQARDSSGNRTVSGFAFDPYSRSLVAAPIARSRPQAIPEPAKIPEAAPIATSTPFYKKRWFQITLGVVAVGAIANSLDSVDEDKTVVPITFNAE